VQFHPDLVELLHGLAHQLGFVGEEARLEVAGVGDAGRHGNGL